MTMHEKVSGVWKEITEMHENVSGTWKEIKEGWENVSGTWKQFFQAAHTLVAGFWTESAGGGSSINSFSGYGDATYISSLSSDEGSITPADVDGMTIVGLYSSSNSTIGSPVNLVVKLLGVRAKGAFTSIETNLGTFNTSAAIHSDDGTVTTWSWDTGFDSGESKLESGDVLFTV